jgi:hypothetical protein
MAKDKTEKKIEDRVKWEARVQKMIDEAKDSRDFRRILEIMERLERCICLRFLLIRGLMQMW